MINVVRTIRKDNRKIELVQKFDYLIRIQPQVIELVRLHDDPVAIIFNTKEHADAALMEIALGHVIHLDKLSGCVIKRIRQKEKEVC